MLNHNFLSRSIRSIGTILPRNFSNSKPDNVMLLGGGLEKLQGGLKEETYFNKRERDLLEKIGEPGANLKCEECLGDWSQFEKVLDTSLEKTALRETCSQNKHKNSKEEAFFIAEQKNEIKIFQGRLERENKNDAFKMSEVATNEEMLNSDK